jgi:hypothetical protein
MYRIPQIFLSLQSITYPQTFYLCDVSHETNISFFVVSHTKFYVYEIRCVAPNFIVMWYIASLRTFYLHDKFIYCMEQNFRRELHIAHKTILSVIHNDPKTCHTQNYFKYDTHKSYHIILTFWREQHKSFTHNLNKGAMHVFHTKL